MFFSLLFAFCIPLISALPVSPFIIPSITQINGASTQVSLLTPFNGELLTNANLNNMAFAITRSPGMPLLCIITVNNQQIVTMNPDLGPTQISFNINEGSNSWSASCIDNSSTVVTPTNTFILDTTPPSIVLPQSQIYSSDGTAQLPFSVSDNIATSVNCNLYVNNVLVQALNVQSNTLASPTVTNISNGNYHWNVSCVDSSANVGNSAIGQLVVSTTSAPFLSISTNKNTYTLGEQGYFLINAPQNATVNLFITTPGGIIIRQFTNQVWPNYDIINFLNFTGNYIADLIFFQGQLTARANVTFNVVSTLTASIDMNESLFGIGEQVTIQPQISGVRGSLNYFWDFGDGSTESGSGILTVKTHTYSVAGEKTISLHVQDSSGSTALAQKNINIAQKFAITVNAYDSIAQTPLSDAAVQIEGDALLTNGQGQVTINAFAGLRELHISKNEYSTYSERINVNEAKTINAFLTRAIFNRTNTTYLVTPINISAALTSEQSQPQPIQDDILEPTQDIAQLQDFEEMYQKVQESIDRITNLNEKEKEFAQIIGLETILKRQLEILNRIRRDQSSLPSLKGDKQERINDIIKNYEGVKQNTMIGFSIKENKRQIIIPSSSKIRSVVNAMFATNLKKVNEKDKEELVREISKLQASVNGETVLWVIDATMLDDSQTTFGVVSRSLQSSSQVAIPIQKMQWHELIEDTNKVELYKGEGNIQSKDIVFAIGAENQIAYGIRDVSSIEPLEEITALALAPWDDLMQIEGLRSITGNSVWSGVFKWEGLKVMLQIVIIIVLLVVYIMYQFDLWDKFKQEKPILKNMFGGLISLHSKQVKQVRSKIALCFSLIENKKDLQKASQIYKEIMQLYDKLHSKGKSAIYADTQDLYYTLSVHQGLEWAEQAKIYVKYGKKEAAYEHYEKIRLMYPGLPKRLKPQIKAAVDELLLLLQFKDQG